MPRHTLFARGDRVTPPLQPKRTLMKAPGTASKASEFLDTACLCLEDVTRRQKERREEEQEQERSS